MKTRIAISMVAGVWCVLMIGCASRTQANIGPIHLGGDVTAHENWNVGFMAGAERTEVGLGLVTVGVDGKWTKCTQAFSLSHKTELTQEETPE